ncbi:hypothetical protein SLE2022_219910 [Rubroshorea leprosula]
MSSHSNYRASWLKLCFETHNQTLAETIHCFILKALTNPEIFLSNNLIDVYSKLGNIRYARYLFDGMPQPNSFSLNTILSAYSKSGQVSNMQDIFNRIPNQNEVS